MLKPTWTILLVSSLLFAEQRLEFEVASVKPNSSVAGVRGACHGIDSKYRNDDVRSVVPLGRCLVSSGRLSHMIGIAYDVSMDMIQGGPSWLMAGERFDVEGKAADPSTATEKQLIEMFRNLLADRFQLKFHREKREISGQALLIAKNGHKLQPARDVETTNPRGLSTPDGKFSIAVVGSRNTSVEDIKGAAAGTIMSITAQGASMDELIAALRPFAGSAVVNETGLDGFFDFKLTFETGQSLTGPMQEQLGLKLESRKVPADYFIVESAERPTRN